MTLVWRRRLGGRRVAHLYRDDGAAVCPWGGVAGSPLVVETQINPRTGKPYGRLCALCELVTPATAVHGGTA
jgi:hypothetical protein